MSEQKSQKPAQKTIVIKILTKKKLNKIIYKKINAYLTRYMNKTERIKISPSVYFYLHILIIIIIVVSCHVHTVHMKMINNKIIFVNMSEKYLRTIFLS